MSNDISSGEHTSDNLIATNKDKVKNTEIYSALLDKLTTKKIVNQGDIEFHEADICIFKDLPSEKVDFTSKSDHPKIDAFFKSLKMATSRLNFMNTSINKWKEYYIYPSESELNIKSKDWKCCINKNEEVIQNWINALLRDIKTAKDGGSQSIVRNSIVGPIGSGKSTFTKRICSEFFSRFTAESILPSRVEFRKVNNNITNENDAKSHMGESIIDCLCRDIFRACLDKGLGPLNLEKTNILETELLEEGFKEFFEEQLKLVYISNEKCTAFDVHIYLDTQYKNFREIVDGYGKFDVERRQSIIGLLPQEHKEVLISYFSNKGWQFLIIFDGFDYINAHDIFEETPNYYKIKALSNILGDPYIYEILSNIKYRMPFHSISVFRDPTLVRLKEKYSEAWTVEGNEYRIFPPDTQSLISSCARRVCQDSEFKKNYPLEKINEIVNQSLLIIILEKDEIQEHDWITHSVFNSNARRHLEFFYLTFKFIYYEFFIDSDVDNLDQNADILTFVEFACSEPLENKIRQKAYRIFETLIHKNYTHFVNFLSFKSSKNPPNGNQNNETLKTNRRRLYQRSKFFGFIDNVFNYDPEERGKISVIGKIRILEYVRARKKVRQAELMEFASRYFTDRFLCLVVLVRVELLEVSWEDGPVYELSEQGEIVLDHIFYKTEYIEHIIGSIAFPAKFAKKLNIIESRVAPQTADNHKSRTENIIEWAAAAMFNSYLFIEYIKEVEKKEGSFLFDSIDNIKFTCIHEKMHDNFHENLKKICAGPHGGDISKYINNKIS